MLQQQNNHGSIPGTDWPDIAILNSEEQENPVNEQEYEDLDFEEVFEEGIGNNSTTENNEVGYAEQYIEEPEDLDADDETPEDEANDL